MNIRLYPLDCYSPSGNLKPPKFFYLVLLFLARTWTVFIISVVLRDSGNPLLLLFYPNKIHFYLGLASGCIALLLFFLSGRDHDKHRYFSILWQSSYPLLLVGVVSDLALQLYYLSGKHFQYSFIASVQLVFAIWVLLYCLRSKQLKDCFKRSSHS
ncbi:MAG: hypothetical protein ACJAZP_002404 [Psychromonas sp.]|jgi:hypothetical protein|uniref:DUF2919 domain-containing protein n=1 Tax=Psychromonas sp. TaxID=1884585 RepID=UPI0039E543C3